MKTNWSPQKRRWIVSLIWILAAAFSALGAMSLSNPWRLLPAVAFLGVGAVFFLTSGARQSASESAAKDDQA